MRTEQPRTQFDVHELLRTAQLLQGPWSPKQGEMGCPLLRPVPKEKQKTQQVPARSIEETFQCHCRHHVTRGRSNFGCRLSYCSISGSFVVRIAQSACGSILVGFGSPCFVIVRGWIDARKPAYLCHISRQHVSLTRGKHAIVDARAKLIGRESNLRNKADMIC